MLIKCMNEVHDVKVLVENNEAWVVGVDLGRFFNQKRSGYILDKKVSEENLMIRALPHFSQKRNIRLINKKGAEEMIESLSKLNKITEEDIENFEKLSKTIEKIEVASLKQSNLKPEKDYKKQIRKLKSDNKKLKKESIILKQDLLDKEYRLKISKKRSLLQRIKDKFKNRYDQPRPERNNIY